MPNFADPLWNESDWGGAPSTTSPFPPSDDERGNFDITQARASAKSGGKSQSDSQWVTTVGARATGDILVWDDLGNAVDGGALGSGTGAFAVFVNGVPTATGSGFQINGPQDFFINGV